MWTPQTLKQTLNNWICEMAIQGGSLLHSKSAPGCEKCLVWQVHPQQWHPSFLFLFLSQKDGHLLNNPLLSLAISSDQTWSSLSTIHCNSRSPSSDPEIRSDIALRLKIINITQDGNSRRHTQRKYRSIPIQAIHVLNPFDLTN